MVTQQPVVIVPGLRGHVAEHWQTHLAAALPNAHVVDSSARDKGDLSGRIADVQQVITSLDEPAIIVAHSAGVLVTVHWAQRFGAGVRGALLATPPDLARPLPAEYPSLDELAAAGWLPIPRQELPFPSLVCVSSNDALGNPALVGGMAAAWGSEVVELGAVGHLNPAAGFGEWPAALDLLGRLERLVAVS